MDCVRIYSGGPLGGLQNGIKSDRVWIVDTMNNFELVEGPSLNFKSPNRGNSQACGTFKDENGSTNIIKYDGKNTEILNTASLKCSINSCTSDSGWTKGLKKCCILKLNLLYLFK